jgi:hypothetical protein
LVQAKLSASAEAHRLKLQQMQEDDRRALQMFWRKDADEIDVHFDELGKNDPVFQKLRGPLNSQASPYDDDDMSDLL